MSTIKYPFIMMSGGIPVQVNEPVYFSRESSEPQKPLTQQALNEFISKMVRKPSARRPEKILHYAGDGYLRGMHKKYGDKEFLHRCKRFVGSTNPNGGYFILSRVKSVYPHRSGGFYNFVMNYIFKV